MSKAYSMHVRDPLPVGLDVDTCPERDVILRWQIDVDDDLTKSMMSIEVSADAALDYAAEIIRVAQIVIVRSVMMS
jgi:hypothetical protein